MRTRKKKAAETEGPADLGVQPHYPSVMVPATDPRLRPHFVMTAQEKAPAETGWKEITLGRERLRVLRLPKGTPRIIHVLAKTLAERMRGEHTQPMIAVRSGCYPNVVIGTFRHVEINGPAALMDTPEAPLPDTNGRGICYLRTNAELLVYEDVKEGVQEKAARFGAELRTNQ